MATTQYSSPDTASSQPVHIESYHSSREESEATSTPSPNEIPRHFPRPVLSSDHKTLPTFSTTQLTLRPRDLRMEESGDESDDVYDQFDLGDFTIDEIKAYESMVGPGERLRDAVPPPNSLAEVLEASCETFKAVLVSYLSY